MRVTRRQTTMPCQFAAFRSPLHEHGDGDPTYRIFRYSLGHR